jgi:hypothetical protein
VKPGVGRATSYSPEKMPPTMPIGLIDTVWSQGSCAGAGGAREDLLGGGRGRRRRGGDGGREESEGERGRHGGAT